MTYRVRRVILRDILDSRGGVSPEIELRLDGGHTGIASACTPRAHKRQGPALGMIGERRADDRLTDLVTRLEGSSFDAQDEFDAVLELLQDASLLTANIAFALSLAFGRAAAHANDQPLHRYISALAGTRPEMPRLLVTIFSAAGHEPYVHAPYSQMMIAPDLGTVQADLEAALMIHAAIEPRMAAKVARFSRVGLQGITIDQHNCELLLEELLGQIYRFGLASNVTLAVASGGQTGRCDVNREYPIMSCEERVAMYCRLVEAYNIRLVADPFDANDTDSWRALTRALCGRAWLVREDTNSGSPAADAATGTLLTMNRVGAITAVSKAARSARAAGMILCLSEDIDGTEDTGLCDLAVAVGAGFVKIGRLRWGDCIPVYNQLLRLSEDIASDRDRAGMPDKNNDANANVATFMPPASPSGVNPRGGFRRSARRMR